MDQEVRFSSGPIVLAGTLALPQGEGPFPCCLLLGGSGPQVRDGSFDFGRTDYFPTPLFLRPLLETEANALSRAGIASLRFDKRGSGESQGEIRTASFDDLVSDAQAALDHLQTLAPIDGNRIGILGQSEGAVVALCAAASRSDLAFYVWQSGFVQPTPELAEHQLLDLQSMPAAELDHFRAAAPYLYWETLQYKSILASALAGEDTFLIGDAEWSMQLGLDYYRQTAALDVPQMLSRLSLPILIVHGADDTVVPAQDAQVAADILAKSQKAEATLRILPGLDHSLNLAGAPPQDIAGKKVILPEPAAVDIVVSWIMDHILPRGKVKPPNNSMEPTRPAEPNRVRDTL